MSYYTETPRTAHAAVLSHSFTQNNKVLQLQVRDRIVSGQGESTDEQSLVRSDTFGAWCLVAIPDAPDRDADGSIKAACEAIAIEDADDLTVIATRDVRYAQFAQDLAIGECALFNKYGSRLALRKDEVSLVAKGGGFISLDASQKLISIMGFPAQEGGNSPYFTVSSDTIGMVSATGQASFTLSGAGVTLSGATVAIDAGSVAIGKGAADFVALASKVLAAFNQIVALYNAHTHTAPALPGLTTTPIVPITGVSPVGSLNVKCA